MTTDEHLELGTRLPEVPEYWDDLAGRVVAHGYPVLSEYQRRDLAWWSPMARFSTALAASALIMLLGYLVAGPPAASPSPLSPMEDAVIPADPMARSMSSTTTGAPAIEVLLPLSPAAMEGP